MLRTSIVWVNLALVVAACSGAGTDSGGDAGGGLHDGSPDGTAPDGTLADALTGDEAPGSPREVAEAEAEAPPTDAMPEANAPEGASNDATTTSACSPGPYAGTFSGSYTSPLTSIGIPVPITGNVTLTLGSAGSPGSTCPFNGGSEDCGDLFPLLSGSVTGAGNALDAGTGGFPFFCSIGGSLDCRTTKFVGWVECTYCVGPLADGGTACALSGVGGGFAGPILADYALATHAFVRGAWNASEALRGNDGGSPGPDGAPISDFLSDSGSYLGPGQYGGSGTWAATHL